MSSSYRAHVYDFDGVEALMINVGEHWRLKAAAVGAASRYLASWNAASKFQMQCHTSVLAHLNPVMTWVRIVETCIHFTNRFEQRKNRSTFKVRYPDNMYLEKITYLN